MAPRAPATDDEIARLRAEVCGASSSSTASASVATSAVTSTSSAADAIKSKESAIEALGVAYASRDDAPAFRALFEELRPLLAKAPKAKTAKIVRGLIEIMGRIRGHDGLQVELCREHVEWARAERRTFLRHRVELRLATLHLMMRDYPEALRVVGALAREVKKLDDKLLLVDIHLLESRIHYALRNLPKSKASLNAYLEEVELPDLADVRYANPDTACFFKCEEAAP